MDRFLFVMTLALFVSYFATRWVGAAAHKWEAIDHPNERKIHHEPVPRLGGIAIWMGFMAAIAGFLVWQAIAPDPVIEIETGREFQGFMLGALIILIVGIIDDVRGLTPIFKFGGQAAAAIVLVSFGVKMEFIGNPFGPAGSLFYLGNIGVAMTIFWVVAFMNNKNFIDGLDGLAAGISVIAALTFFAFGWQTGQMGTSVVALALAGASLGFLRHNFYPAKIFMGDSGSMFLGFCFGALTVEGVMKSVAAVALFSPLVIMGIPILDTALAVLRRYISRSPVTQADRDHLHHRLIRRGLTHRQTVLLIYGWSAGLSIVGLTFKVMPSMQKYIIIIIGLFLTVLFAEVVGLFDRRTSAGAGPAPGAVVERDVAEEGEETEESRG